MENCVHENNISWSVENSLSCRFSKSSEIRRADAFDTLTIAKQLPCAALFLLLWAHQLPLCLLYLTDLCLCICHSIVCNFRCILSIHILPRSFSIRTYTISRHLFPSYLIVATIVPSHAFTNILTPKYMTQVLLLFMNLHVSLFFYPLTITNDSV